MREDVELIFPNGGQHARGDEGGIEPGLNIFRDCGHHRSRRACRIERLRLAEYTGLREDVETVAIRTQEEFDRLANATFLRPKPGMSAERPQPPANE